MLNASSLATEMKNAVGGKTDAIDALSSLSTAISEYIKSNAVITFSWIAVNPSGVPDPMTSASGAFTSVKIVLTPSGTDNYQQSQSQFSSQCDAGLSASMYNITDAGFSSSPASPGTTIPLALSIPETNSYDEAMNALASDIVDWVKQQIPSVPVSGSHGAYVGVGSVVSIQ